jgi:hypothetical protein
MEAWGFNSRCRDRGDISEMAVSELNKDYHPYKII